MKLIPVTLLMAACATSPFWPNGHAEPFDALPEYSGWYAEAEECRGLQGDFSVVTFYTVEDEEGVEDELGKKGLDGVHDKGRIFLLSGLERNKPLVVHEMLHHILSYHISPLANRTHADSLSFWGPNACDFIA